MHGRLIDMRLIETAGRLRPVNKARAQALAESISEVGMLNPLTVTSATIIRNAEQVDGFQLVAGAHRLEAAWLLGWSEIPAVVMDLDEASRTIAECDENLCREELTPAQRAQFTAARKAAYEVKHPETRNGGDRKGSDRKLCELIAAPRFTQDTAARTGRSERAVQLDAQRGASICDEAFEMIKGTPLDTGKFLDRLKGMEPAQQVEAVRKALARDKPKPAPKVKPAENDDAVEARQYDALIRAWNKAGKEARRMFLQEIGQ